MMRRVALLYLLLPALALATSAEPPPPGEPAEKESDNPPLRKEGSADVRVLHVIPHGTRPNYPAALPSLLRLVSERTSIKIDPEPHVVRSFEDPAIFQYPFIYVNFGDRKDWTFSELERRNLRRYLQRGGFIFVDAGISAEFLRGDRRHGQHHSFAEWQAHPDLEEAFQKIWAHKTFQPLPRTHKLYRTVYKGLPDAAQLPDTVREFVVNEKWPQGTYSAVGLRVDGRIAVLATPIIAMGWGRDELGNWRTRISFRIRESAPNLAERLETASYGGERYEAVREDGRKDIIYCQRAAMPAWVKEPDRWRVFRYYHGREISDFAHQFYSQLGVNILAFAMTQ